MSFFRLFSRAFPPLFWDDHDHHLLPATFFIIATPGLDLSTLISSFPPPSTHLQRADDDAWLLSLGGSLLRIPTGERAPFFSQS